MDDLISDISQMVAERAAVRDAKIAKRITMRLTRGNSRIQRGQYITLKQFEALRRRLVETCSKP